MKPLADRQGTTISELFNDDRGMDAAMKRGVRRALASSAKPARKSAPKRTPRSRKAA